MKHIVKKNIGWREESICPKCGHRMPRHGGFAWGGETCELVGPNYERWTDARLPIERYVCPECKSEWEVRWTSAGDYYADGRMHCVDVEPDPIAEDGSSWLSADGKKLYYEIFDDAVRYAVTVLGIPDKEWDED